MNALLSLAIDLPRRIVRAELGLVLPPVQAAEDRLLERMAHDDARRLRAERLLGRVDGLAGRLLDDDGLRERSVTLLEHADSVARAKALDTEADAPATPATDDLKAARERARASHEAARQA